ncbi:MAG: hypothetical protein WCG45_00215 [bacterium]
MNEDFKKTTYSPEFTSEDIKEIEALMAEIPNYRMNNGCEEPHEFDNDSILQEQKNSEQQTNVKNSDENIAKERENDE